MRYVTEDNKEESVVVRLWQSGDEVVFDVGSWCIGRLCKDGTFRLSGGIYGANSEGLKVDSRGRIIIKES